MNYLNEFSPLISVIATLGLIGVTGGLWYATAKMARSSNDLVKESKILREGNKKPLVEAKLRAYPDQGEFIELVLSNLGPGVALNVKFRLEGDEEDFKRHEMLDVKGNASPINFMSSGEFETYPLGACRTLAQEPPMKPFLVVIEYEDIERKSYIKDVTLDVSQFDGVEWHVSSVAWRQMSALEQIEKHFARME